MLWKYNQFKLDPSYNYFDYFLFRWDLWRIYSGRYWSYNYCNFTTLSGLNLVETNSHKVFVIGISAIVSLIVFIFYSKIRWSIGLSLAAGNGMGGWIGSHWAVTRGERFIRQILVICVVAMVVKLLY